MKKHKQWWRLSGRYPGIRNNARPLVAPPSPATTLHKHQCPLRREGYLLLSSTIQSLAGTSQTPLCCWCGFLDLSSRSSSTALPSGRPEICVIRHSGNGNTALLPSTLLIIRGMFKYHVMPVKLNTILPNLSSAIIA